MRLCERCDKEFEHLFTPNDTNLELCASCVASFDKWWTGGKG